MKLIYIILILFCVISCKEKSKEKLKIEPKGMKDVKDQFNDLKADIGLPESYSDTLSLISYHFDDADNDKKFFKTDYKKNSIVFMN